MRRAAFAVVAVALCEDEEEGGQGKFEAGERGRDDLSEKEAEGGAAYPVELAEGFDARDEARVGVASHRGDEAVGFVGQCEDAVGEEQRAAAVGGGREGETVEDEA